MWLPYCAIYFMPVIYTLALFLGGWWYAVIPFMTFFIVPICEILYGEDGENSQQSEMRSLTEDKIYKRIVWFWAPIQFYVLTIGLIASNHLSFLENLLSVANCGMIAGIAGINVAHELIHRHTKWEKFLGRAILLSVGYLHYEDHHLHIHHKYLCSSKDCTVANLGESLYKYLYRMIPRTLQETYEYNPCKFSIVMIVQALFLSTILLLGGIFPLLFFLVQSAIAIFLLESIEYIEHYGLIRLDDQPISIHHSWNTDTSITNFILLKLQRHSDHHLHAYKRYQTLNNYSEAPTLPTGYAGSLIIALIPKLWFSIMDPKLYDIFAKEKVYKNE